MKTLVSSDDEVRYRWSLLRINFKKAAVNRILKAQDKHVAAMKKQQKSNYFDYDVLKTVLMPSYNSITAWNSFKKTFPVSNIWYIQ